jgi:hypothetical protein
MANKIEMDISEFSSDENGLLKGELDLEQGYQIEVEQVSEGEATSQYGVSNWVSLSDGETIYFFSSYEGSTLKTIIGEKETPFTIKMARTSKTSKNGRDYTIVVGEVVG